MKNCIKIFTILLCALLNTVRPVFAQSPQKISYQAVIRDASNNLVINQVVGMQISIIEGTADGSAIYIETHIPTSNNNGLVAIEIGNGTNIFGDFATIDWSTGSYFVKIESDPNGGTNYTLTGVSQLLSVPYALHATTANSATYAEAALTAVTATNAENAITATTANTVVNYPPEIDGDINNEIQTISRSGLVVSLSKNGGTYQDSINIYTAGAGIDITNNIISIITEKHYIGEFYEDGVIFYVDHTGEHGLIVSLYDVDGGAGVEWSDVTNKEIGAEAHCYYNGASNTEAIIAQQTQTSAAQLCHNYGEGWYLPASFELNELYNAVLVINKVLAEDGDSNTNGLTISESTPYGRYWTSTEYSNNIVWYFEFRDGRLNYFGKNSSYRVRAIKAF